MKKIRLVSLLLVMVLMSSMTLVSAFASAPADYPKDNIKILVPFDAGGGTDTMARIFSSAAGRDYFNGHSLIVENKGGGGGVIGQTYVAKEAPADGYTVMLFTSSVINNSILKQVTYSYEDFKPLIGSNPDSEIIVVPSESPFNTLEDMIEAAKANRLKVSTPGHSSGHHIRAMNMARLMDLDFVYIHSDSAAMQLTQVMGNHCDVAYMTVSEASGAVVSGKAKALGVMAKDRDPSLPDVPTFAEQGYEGWIDGANRGFAVHKDTPDDIYQYLIEEFSKVALSEKYIEAMKKAGMNYQLQTTAEYQEYIDRTIEAIQTLAPELK